MLNPYFMHPSDNPGTAIVTPPSYEWKQLSHLVKVDDGGFVIKEQTSSLPRPMNEDRDSLAWDQCNTMIMSWINSSIILEILQSILWMDTSTDVWKDLKERFYQEDMFRIFD